MSNILTKPKNIPNTPGIYIFLKNKRPLYVGKALNLRKRLASYFRKDQNSKTSQLLKESNRLKLIKTESEVDALIKEAELIKKYQPKYNIVMRDDKSYFYVAFTREKFPKIFLTHQPFRIRNKSKIKNFSDFALHASNFTNYIGPFTSGVYLKLVLKLLRKIFPYCTCGKPHNRPCLNYQIGRCLGFCCFKPNPQHTNILEDVGMFNNAKREYKKNIENIVSVLDGKKKQLISGLKNHMNLLVKKQEFENAAKIRDQIFGLENIFQHHKVIMPPLQYIDVSKWTKIEKNIKQILKTNRDISRVEGYDISNISGKEATGSMIVFIDGKPAKNDYRKFRIKTVNQISDVDMLKEVIGRRSRHTEWQLPDLMLIDGGKPQLNAALSQFSTINRQQSTKKQKNKNYPLIAGLAKREEELYIEDRPKPIKLSSLPQETAFFFQQVRDESHRFAKKYHHKLRELMFKNDK